MENAEASDSNQKTAVVSAANYLNKLTGDKIERECRTRIDEGCKRLIVDFSHTEIVNSVGISILLGVIDAAESAGATVVFSDVNEHTAELFEMLGVSRHAIVNPN